MVFFLKIFTQKCRIFQTIRPESALLKRKVEEYTVKTLRSHACPYSESFVPIVGRRLANNCGCKFIETSSGLAHHVDELLVGILAQIKLNPQRSQDQATSRRRSKHRRRILKHLLGFKRRTKSCENLLVL